MSCHRVQHTLRTAFTQDCLSSLYSHDYELTHESSFSFRRTSLHDRRPSASTSWELKGKVTLSHSHGCGLPNWWMESHHPVRHPWTASKYSSNLAQSRPPSASPISLDHCLKMHPQTRSITASKCISKLPRLRPASSQEHGLQVHLQTRSITISEGISKFTRLLPRSVSPNMLDYRLLVHLQTRSITASEYITEFIRLSFSGALHIALNHRLQPVQIYRV